MRFLCMLSLCLWGLSLDKACMAQQSNETSAIVADHLPNVDMPTLGGSQFWTDHAWRRGWRIQQNALTDHWRLLDDQNVRRAWGSRSACEELLNSQVPDATLPVTHVVVYLHGLMRTWRSMRPVADVVHEQLELPAVYFEYASTRSSIGQHALALRETLATLPKNLQLSFVGHSMGNIVLRHAIGDLKAANDVEMLARFHRVVMLGPPNQGSSIARQLAKTGVFGWVAGSGGLELGPQWNDFSRRLARPECQFGIIAGNLVEQRIQNPLIEGGSDFVVTVEETKLDGANDFLEVPQLHSFLMDDENVHVAVVNFLRSGRFSEEAN